jgi:large subunit ribosomal protein L18
MIKSFNANKARLRRHRRVRKRVQGTAERPRLSVFRSAEHIYAQIIDDEHGTTLVAASSLEKSERDGSGKSSSASMSQQAPKSAKGAKVAKAEQAPEAKDEKAGKGGKGGKGGKAEQAAPPPAEADEDGGEDVAAGLKGIATNHKVMVAQSIGRLIAERAKERGITKVVFDRGGYIYHGRVAALAAGAREGGLDF